MAGVRNQDTGEFIQSERNRETQIQDKSQQMHISRLLKCLKLWIILNYPASAVDIGEAIVHTHITPNMRKPVVMNLGFHSL